MKVIIEIHMRNVFFKSNYTQINREKELKVKMEKKRLLRVRIHSLIYNKANVLSQKSKSTKTVNSKKAQRRRERLGLLSKDEKEKATSKDKNEDMTVEE